MTLFTLRFVFAPSRSGGWSGRPEKDGKTTKNETTSWNIVASRQVSCGLCAAIHQETHTNTWMHSYVYIDIHCCTWMDSTTAIRFTTKPTTTAVAFVPCACCCCWPEIYDRHRDRSNLRAQATPRHPTTLRQRVLRPVVSPSLCHLLRTKLGSRSIDRSLDDHQQGLSLRLETT